MTTHRQDEEPEEKEEELVQQVREELADVQARITPGDQHWASKQTDR